jgi:hypothetical protein
MRNRPIVAPGLAAAVLVAAVPGHGQSAAGGIVLIPPAQPTARDTIDGLLKFKLGNLSRIDPAKPLESDNAAQTLSMFGREDLIAATSGDYSDTACKPVTPVRDPVSEIVRRARSTSIVIISESHERSDHRGVTTEVARRLRPLGYGTLAMETLTHNAPGVKADFNPPFVRAPGLPYLSDDDGFYLSEAGFGRLGRAAKSLGYRLVPYEMIFTGPPAAGLTRAQQIATREEAQAATLAAYVKAHPREKLLVHVGYSHVGEVATKAGDRWMAARLKAKTGIDPLTISQTICHGSADGLRLSQLPAAQPVGLADLLVDHPAARFVRGRPQWRVAAGDRPAAIPAALMPTTGWRVIEARPAGEPDASVPMDRVAVRSGDAVALMLPPGRYRLRAIDVAYAPPPRTAP